MDITYTVQRSPKRRKLTITVERDRKVVVHAPVKTTDERIQEIVEAKRQWISEKTRHAQKYQELPHPPGKELVSGESALYLGRHYRIEVVKDGLTDVHFDHKFLIAKQHLPKRKNVLRAWYVTRAKDKILPRVKHRARELGVDYAAAKIVDNRYRWGSCTVKDNINLNWRLIKAPMFVIDYVIIHELVHLIEANHTPRFWSIVKTHAPKLDVARSWLRKHGQILEEDV